MNRTTPLLMLLAVALLTGCPGDGEATWSSPLDGEDLDRVTLSVWGSSADDVYVVGGGLGNGLGSLALHYDGSSWRELDNASSNTFWWTWGTGSSVYFVGEGGTVYKDNEPLTSPTDRTLYGVWGTADNDVWIVGGNALATTPEPALLHYKAGVFTDHSAEVASLVSGALFKVWGSGPSDVFAVGQNGTILHWNGTDWQAQTSPTSSFLFTVYGAGPEDVWAVGGPRAVVLHYDGAAWAEVDTGIPASVFNGVSVGPTGDVLVVGSGGVKLRQAGGAWTDETNNDPRVDLHAAWIDPEGGAWVVGGNFNAPASPGSVRVGVVGYHGTTPPPSQITR